MPATVTISVAFGCPFEGRVDPARVAELAERFEGARGGARRHDRRRRSRDEVRAPGRGATRTRAGFHGHNTRNTGYANALAALEAGAEVLDASVGGLGGCPYAPRASGNIATEDLVYLLEREGIETGVDLDALIAISEWLEAALGRKLEGQLYRAGTWPAYGLAEGVHREGDLLVARLPVRDREPDRLAPVPGRAAQPDPAALLDEA